ncbi:MAG: hypothetical protein ABSA92_14100 [Candidatus Bathyarchaeia archaeon]|jgi:hypothetical protein
MKKGIVEVLVKTLCTYEPAVDDITIDLIIQSKINYNKISALLNSPKATEYTYSRLIDAEVKLVKIIYDGLEQLAISRHGEPPKRLIRPDSDVSSIDSTLNSTILDKYYAKRAEMRNNPSCGDDVSPPGI